MTTAITGYVGFFVAHFPEENGQNSSPPARDSSLNVLIG
jgi:hypothetical protein